ncbi:MAG: biotin--[acetyl-CoA-carboxylase] ligase [Gammaproteobacteria bacterium]
MTQVSDTRWRVLRLLVDGRFHSGADMARRLGISRAAIWKQKQALEKLGLNVQAVRGRGYRLVPAAELLDVHCLRDAVAARGKAWGAARVKVVTDTDSTNALLWRRVDESKARDGDFVLAEMQAAGRGRRGRTWQSPPARNLYLSHYRRLDCDPMRLNGLSLAVGAVLADALGKLLARQCPVPGGVSGAVGVKWPNDLVARGGKLGGLLIELRGQTGGPVDVVLGVGINLSMDSAAAKAIDQPWTDLSSLCGEGAVGRNEAAICVMTALADVVEGFMAAGFEGFVGLWSRLDILRGHPVTVHQPGGDVEGVASGVTDGGALRVRVGGTERTFHSGEVSVRLRT